MTESKKEWVTPELIVLVRSKPEEAVLLSCKMNVVGITGMNSTNVNCFYRRSNTNCSTACSWSSSS